MGGTACCCCCTRQAVRNLEFCGDVSQHAVLGENESAAAAEVLIAHMTHTLDALSSHKLTWNRALVGTLLSSKDARPCS